MGCCYSSSNPPKSHFRHRTAAGAGAVSSPQQTPLLSGGWPVFSEYSFSDLKAATNNFSSEFLVSESGEKAPNLVYKGRLKNQRWIAVKKFTRLAWPDPKQFAVSEGFGFLGLALFVKSGFGKWVGFGLGFRDVGVE
ncbi:hypothetical protein Droror1_Dr00006888 [Drosera rotundifolia]